MFNYLEDTKCKEKNKTPITMFKREKATHSQKYLLDKNQGNGNPSG